MESTSHEPPKSAGTTGADHMFWRRLLYRWFIEYNPAYLLSAALVFGGCFLWSRGIVHDEGLASTLGIPFVAELYAFALIGGAALLTRLGQRRPAVMLALIVVVYQWDTTLHTEACAFLGKVGVWAAAVWLVAFAGKIFALAKALRIRVGRRMLGASALAAIGFVAVPRALLVLDARGAGSLLAIGLFALAMLYREAEISSVDPLDAWGETVLRRATHAAWAISTAMIGLHAFMWCANAEVSLAPLLFVAPLVAVVRVRSEARTWALAGATLAVCAIASPGSFFATSLVTAGAFLLRVFAPQFSPVQSIEPDSPVRVHVPYRAGRGEYYEPRTKTVRVPAPALDPGEIARSHAAALFAAYLCVWTIGWTHGAFPAHRLLLDLAVTAVAAFAIWRTRASVTFSAPLVLIWLDVVVRAHIVPAPHTDAAWGELGVALGFALLGTSLAVSYRLRGFVDTPENSPR